MGSGGFGKVYKIENVKTGKVIALKHLYLEEIEEEYLEKG